jgi:hypothetical protein
MMTLPPEDQYEKDTFSLFSDKIDQEEFSKRFRSLDEKTMGRFIRACYLHQKALKLRSSEPDISMALLCTSIESAIDSSSSLVFKDWLVKKKLGVLSGKDLDATRKVLNSLYEEYLASEEEREGVTYNFKRFLVKYCPEGVRKPPIIIYLKGGTRPRVATFEEAVTYVYAKFRSLFIHQGIGRLERPPSTETLVYSSLLDKKGADHYAINVQEVSTWFERVVSDSIWSWFSSF